MTNSSFVESRTRTYPPKKPFNAPFDCELPEEARSELSQEKQKTFRKPPPTPPPDVVKTPSPAKREGRVVAIMCAIGLVSLFFYAVSSRRDGLKIPTVPPSVPAPLSQPVEVRAVEVRRALPTDTGFPGRIGTQRVVRMPDGSTVWTTFKGYLALVSQLPIHGSQRGDMWAVGDNYWVLTTPLGSFRQGWVDPPGDGAEIRRSLPRDGVMVRRAKLVVPRAELLRLASTL